MQANAASRAPGDLRVWHLTTGETGTRQQARGLATALSPRAEERLVRVSRIWAALVPRALIGLSPAAVTPLAGRLEPPWPDVLVSCGRRSALVAMAIRRRNPAPMVCIHIQPPTYPEAFDLVIVMPHDRLDGANVLRVDTALHAIGPAILAAAAAGEDPWFAGLPRPWTGVLLGGSTRRQPFAVEDALRLADQLDALRGEIGGSLLITPSRRTPPAVLGGLGARYLADQTVRFWDGAGPNPYVAILARADRLVVTSDSVSMISEALAASAPVSIFQLPAGRRHSRFLQALVDKAIVAPLGAAAPSTPRVAIDATPVAAAAARRLIAERLAARL
ncbi:mitochondrial fission ELM1 family protein [Phenylobacterium sp.]|uniref:mitochondrial fission ELM1 family protein n=1 Tax=Phenylobacterium sp. TaxID=1871053 RepID=UPI002E3564BC|nr:mitochondrial fission ELM1 family protein [Phenylobacterium sp.]HEX3364445.1 mitochondrial fission ELM1 family protein [Phenylobacterium sp.]